MADPVVTKKPAMTRTLTKRERLVLLSLRPHARLHARSLLVACPDLRATSGLRTRERNRAVGGSPSSFHVRGRACDFVAEPGYLQWAAGVARQQRVTPACTGPEEVLVHDAGSGLHLHVAW